MIEILEPVEKNFLGNIKIDILNTYGLFLGSQFFLLLIFNFRVKDKQNEGSQL